MPIYLWLIAFVGVLGIPAVTSAVLYRGALATGRSRASATRIAAFTAVGWAAWIAVVVALAGTGLLSDSVGRQQPWFPVAFVVGLVIALAASRLPAIRSILAHPETPRLLAWPHALRVAGVVFLIAMAMGRLPAAFALPAGVGDILVGLAAPFAARSGRVRKLNISGLADLVVALTMGALTGVGTVVILDVSPSSAALATLPLALVPLTAVPLAIALHVVSLTALAGESRRRQVVAA